MRRSVWEIVVVASLLFGIAPLEGVIWMVPLGGSAGFENGSNNTSIDTATYWEDTNRLAAIYGMLETQPHYYSFDISGPSQQVVIKLYRAPATSETTFFPGMVIMGPSNLNLDAQYDADMENDIEVPLGYDTRTRINRQTAGIGVLDSLPPYGYYELDTVVLVNQLPGRYFIAVFSHQVPGHFALSMGEVEWFYFIEFLAGPVYAVQGWIWTGQNVGLALLTVWLTIIGGIIILSWQGCYLRHSPRTWFNWVVCMGGFIILSSCFVVVQEILIVLLDVSGIEDYSDIWVTVFWILCPLMLGFIAIFLGLMSHINILIRFLLLLVFLLSVLTWSGYYLGPFLVFLGAFLPMHNVPWHKCCPCMRDPKEENESTSESSEDEINEKKEEKSKLLSSRADKDRASGEMTEGGAGKKKVIRDYGDGDEEEEVVVEEGTEMLNMATRSSGHDDDEEGLEVVSESETEIHLQDDDDEDETMPMESQKKSHLTSGSATEPMGHTGSETERQTGKTDTDRTERLDSKRKGKEEESETERIHSFSDRTLSHGGSDSD